MIRDPLTLSPKLVAQKWGSMDESTTYKLLANRTSSCTFKDQLHFFLLFSVISPIANCRLKERLRRRKTRRAEKYSGVVRQRLN